MPIDLKVKLVISNACAHILSAFYVAITVSTQRPLRKRNCSNFSDCVAKNICNFIFAYETCLQIAWRKINFSSYLNETRIQNIIVDSDYAMKQKIITMRINLYFEPTTEKNNRSRQRNTRSSTTICKWCGFKNNDWTTLWYAKKRYGAKKHWNVTCWTLIVCYVSQTKLYVFSSYLVDKTCDAYVQFFSQL